MIKRMAGKLGSHLGHHKSIEDSHHQLLSSSPSPAQFSSASTLSHFDHRGSISTERTSLSEWSKRSNSLDVMEAEKPVQRVLRRPKGTYRLTDFIIQRTLGTGSFGRVHLGLSVFLLFMGFRSIDFSGATSAE